MRLNRVLIGVFAGYSAFAQGGVSVDLLDPFETSGTIPANLRIVDIFVDVAATDVWTAAGIRVITSNGGALAYHDEDAGTPGVQPGLLNPGLADRFLTSLSRPRPRDGNGRFLNGSVAIAGSYNPPAAEPVTTPGELNVAYFGSDVAPSADGYIARIAVDVSGVSGAPPENALWQAGMSAPPGSVIVLSCVPPPPPAAQNPGLVITTVDVPQLSGINWQLWYLVPEPSTAALLLIGGTFLLHRRRA